MASGWKLADAYHLPSTVAGIFRIGKDSDDAPLPNPTEGLNADRLGASVDVIPNASSGSQDTFTKETFPIDQKGELTQTHIT